MLGGMGMTARDCSKGTALAAAILFATTPSVSAQDDEGGQLLTFGVSQSLSYQTNPDLAADPEGGAIGTTDLTFRFSDTTRSQQFVFTGQTSLRIGDTDLSMLSTPTFGLSYQIEAADTVLSFGANWARSDVNQIATASDFLQDDGSVVLPVDFDVLDPELDGTRTAASITTRLVTGRTQPLQYTLSATLGQTTYSGDVTDILDDSQTLTLGSSLRLTLDDVTRATVRLTYTQFDTEDAADDSEQFAFSTNWRRDTPRGLLRVGFSALETTNGTRIGVDTSRQINLPRTQLTFGAGLTRPADGDWQLTGQISGNHALPTGQLTFSAQEQFQTSSNGTDRRVTTLRGGWTQRLSPLGQINLNVDFLQSRTDLTTTGQTGLSAAYAHTLTPDWTLNAGVQLNRYTESGRSDTQNESLFVSLSRSFTTRP